MVYLILTATTDTSFDSWTSKCGIFGKFLELPSFLPRPIAMPNDMIKALAANDAACKQSLAGFDSYMNSNPRVPPSLVNNAVTRSHNFPIHLQALYQAVFLRKSAWELAEAAAPTVFEHAHKAMCTLRDGAQLTLTVGHIRPSTKPSLEWHHWASHTLDYRSWEEWRLR